MAEQSEHDQSFDLNDDFELDEALPPLEGDEDDAPGPDSDRTVDLDKYGIWVKGEPEDFTEEQNFDDTEMELEDLSLEEEGMDDMGSDETISEDSNDMIEDLDLPEEESLSGLDEAEEELEEISADEEISVLENGESTDFSMDEMESETISGGNEDFEEVSLDDLGIELSEENPEEEGASKEASRGQSVTQSSEPSVMGSGTPMEDDSDAMVHGDEDFPELSLDLEEEESEFKAAEDQGAEEELDELSLPDEEAFETGEIVVPEAEELTLEESGEAALPEIGEEEDLSSLDSLEEIPELEYGQEETSELLAEDEGEEIEVSLSEDDAIEESDHELESLGAGLSGREGSEAGSTSILSRIESELRSIKSELTALKSELGVLRGGKAAGKAAVDHGAGDEAGQGAFFEEEEEDETIALTGEELDNILTTADIKEEEETLEAEENAEEEALDLGDDIISLDEEETGGAVLSAPEAEEAEEAPADLASLDLGSDEDLSSFPQESGEPELPGDEIEIEIPEFDEGGMEPADAGEAEEIPSIDIDHIDDDMGIGLESELSLDEEPVGELDELELTPAESAAAPEMGGAKGEQIPSGLKEEIKSVLGYMDHLLESLPEEKIEEFAKSEYFSIYKKLFEELGLVS